MSKILFGKTIIITRPVHQAEYLAGFIQDLGGKPIIFPTLEILPVQEDSHLLAIIKQAPQYQIGIFVSANAVNYTFALQPQFNPNMLTIAIGPGTARALQQYHIPVNAVPQFHHSQGILTLPALQHIAGKKIAIFCGENSRSLLKNTLIARKAIVDEIVCYRRRCPDIDAAQALAAWQNEKIGLIISTSSENLTNLCHLFANIASQWLLQTPLLVISAEMHEQAKQWGFQSVIVAEGASDQAIGVALCQQFLS